jgi:hypothetical protein
MNITGSFLNKITWAAQNLGGFFPGKSCVLVLTKIGLGYILGDFYTNSSGHPVVSLVPSYCLIRLREQTDRCYTFKNIFTENVFAKNWRF